MSENKRHEIGDQSSRFAPTVKAAPVSDALGEKSPENPTNQSAADRVPETKDPAPMPGIQSGNSHARSHGGSLRSKLVLSLAAMFFLFLTIDEMVRQRVIRPAFLSMERNGAIQDSNRVLAAINSEVQHLREFTEQTASRFKHARTHQGVGLSVTEDVIVEPSGVTWAAIIDGDGSRQWIRRSSDLPGEETSSTEETDLFLESVARIDNDSSDSIAGMTRIGRHTLVIFAAATVSEPASTGATQNVVANEVFPNDAEERTVPNLDPSAIPIRLVLAREVDTEMVAKLRRQTHVEFSLDATPFQSSPKKLEIWEASKSTFVEVNLSDPFDRELATLLVDVPRDISHRSNQTSAMARQSFILGASAALLLLLLLLQRIVIGPLTAIREYSERVAVQGLETEPLVIPRNDEIGELARAFERMMQRLGAAQIRLASASRAAGMSQVADTVIHNVGNVLTNVNSLMESATDRVARLRVEPIGKLADRLKQTDTDSAFQQAMPDYLHGLADTLEQDQRDLSELLTTLNDNIRHIHDVIRDQRRHATTSVEQEKIRLDDLVTEAIRCCQARLQRDSVNVRVADPLAVSILGDRSMLLQIVINIIGNARQALRETESDSRSLTISTIRNSESVDVHFRDNGCGMSDATLSNVFEAHYTTRDHGSGLGLHFCAITLKRMGGSIRATSEGEGKGSTFVLQLPMAKPETIQKQEQTDITRIADASGTAT